MDRILTYTIQPEQEGMQLLDFLRNKGFSRGILSSMKADKNAIQLNGERGFGKSVLQVGDSLHIHIPEADNTENILPVRMDLSILYEDEDILVINKAADMPVHPSIGNYDNTLANGVAWYFKEKGQHFVYRCINRLDRDTSGLTVISKHLVSASIMADMTKKRLVHREYLAIVKGDLTPPTGTITAPLSRKEGSIIERTVDFDHGEEAITHYKLVKKENGHSLVSLQLETGRTHQIRIHMKYLGYPLIGDYLYNPDMEHITRQALHSYHMEFPHPITGQKMTFTAPLPSDMSAISHL